MIDNNDNGYTDNDGDGVADNLNPQLNLIVMVTAARDYIDIDSDNDGVFDVVEGGDAEFDTNGDGVIDSNDIGYADADKDGMSDNTESTTQPDYDGDGSPDYLDIDSDNDGFSM